MLMACTKAHVNVMKRCDLNTPNCSARELKRQIEGAGLSCRCGNGLHLPGSEDVPALRHRTSLRLRPQRSACWTVSFGRSHIKKLTGRKGTGNKWEYSGFMISFVHRTNTLAAPARSN